MIKLASCLAMASAILIVAGDAGAAAAGTTDGKFAVEGIGRANCEALLKARADKAPAYAGYIGYIEGYLTAANRYEPDTFDLTPWQNSQAFALILTGHCTKNPKDTLVAVAQKIVVTMRPRRLTQYSDLVLVGDDKTRRRVYKSVLVDAQSALSKKGLYTGPSDGRYSPRVKQAFEAFQKTNNLQPTGVPDTATLWLLLNP